MSMFARLAIWLGIWRWRPSEKEQRALLDRLRTDSTTGGPLLASASEPAGREIVELIAKESARQFSFRTGRHSRDPEWERLEVSHLQAWFAEFHAAFWRVPPRAKHVTGRAASEDDTHGYFSIVVPIDDISYQSISAGLLPVLCARLDPQAVAFAARQDGTQLRLLAYAHVAVTAGEEAPDPEMMLASSLGHLASLLLRFFPDRGAWRSVCRFSIICEVSNVSQGDMLRMFGFTEVTRSHGGRTEIVRSPAGFKLFEARVTPGAEGDALLRIIASALPDSTPILQGAGHVDRSPREPAGRVAPAMG